MGDFSPTPGSRSGRHAQRKIQNNRIMSNISGGLAVPIDNRLTAILDAIIGNAGGTLIARDPALGWVALGVGADNTVLSPSAAYPGWQALSALLDAVFGSTEGQILQRGAAAWQVLAPGTSVQYLKSGGAAALNAWTQPSLSSLSDYSTGSWTPADDSGASLSFTILAAGAYVQIGPLVRITASIQYPVTADGSAAAVKGLPFTAAKSGINVLFATTIAGGGLQQISTTNNNLRFLTPSLIVITNAQLSNGAVVIDVIYSQ